MSDAALSLLVALARMRDHLPPSPSQSKRHADTAWRIQERGAPSPRAYIQLVNAWIRQVRAALRQMLRATHADATAEEEEARRRQALQFGIALNMPNAIPDPPDEQQVGRAIKPAAQQAMRAARSGLLAAGLPREVMESRLLIPSGPEDLLTGIDIAPTVQDREILRVWARNGTDLIKTVGQELVAGLDEHVVEWARSGASTRSLAEVVMERLGVAERHAQFIARDQVAKLNSAVTESTQQAAGVTRYRWRSSNDQRTRPMHLALDGSVQSWDAPPVTAKDGARNHPGEDYQCRCVAIPIIEGIDDDTPRAPKERRAPIPDPEAPVVERPTLPPTATPEEHRVDHLDGWVHGSRSKKAVAWKQAAIDELGAGGAPYSRRKFDFKPEETAAARKSIRLQYDQTQESLRARGITEIRLYRGIKTEYDGVGSIESWTTDLETAKKFAGPRGRVLVETIPASRVVAHSGGPGWKNGRFGEQHEWMVLGER